MTRPEPFARDPLGLAPVQGSLDAFGVMVLADLCRTLGDLASRTGAFVPPGRRLSPEYLQGDLMDCATRLRNVLRWAVPGEVFAGLDL